jgi:hypothetical protein
LSRRGEIGLANDPLIGALLPDEQDENLPIQIAALHLTGRIEATHALFALLLFFSGCASNMPPPSAGMHWQMTFDDEFTKDSSVRTDLWNGNAWPAIPGDPRGSNTSIGQTITPDSGGTLTTADGTWSFGTHLYYCGNAIMLKGVRAGFSCATMLLAYNGEMYAESQDSSGNPIWAKWTRSPGDFSGISFTSTNGVVFQPTLNPSVGGILYTGNPDLPAPWQTKFSQRFGYWEWRMKLPHDVKGEGNGLHPTIWLWPIGLDFAPPCGPDHGGEIDVTESVIGPNSQDHTFFTVHDSCDGSGDTSFPYPAKGTANLSDWHTYALYWRDDDSQGSLQPYFDGVPQGNPVTIKFSTAWQNGAYAILQMDPCTGAAFDDGVTCDASTDHKSNPWMIQYMRVWKLVSNLKGDQYLGFME